MNLGVGGMKEFSQSYTREYLADVKKLLDTIEQALADELDKLVSLLSEARKNKNTVFLMGNGGSATTASHIAQDLGKCLKKDSLNDNRVKLLKRRRRNLKSVANDASYE